MPRSIDRSVTDMQPSQGRSRNRQLREIDTALRMSAASVSQNPPLPAPLRGPAVPRSLVHALMAYFGVDFIVSMLREHAGLNVPGLSFWLSVACAMAAYAVTYSKAPHKTWTAKIYALLADYDPKDKDAYQRLQEDVRRIGLERHRVEEWLAEEWRAVAAGETVQADRDASQHARIDVRELLETIDRADELLPQCEGEPAKQDALQHIRDELLPMLDQAHAGTPLSDEQRQLHNECRAELNRHMGASLEPIAERHAPNDPQDRFLNKQLGKEQTQ